MIDYVSGTLKRIDRSGAVVDVSGIGIRVEMSTRDISELPPPESSVSFYVRPLLRDDRAILYGFTSEERRRLFNFLIAVPSVGPSTAMGLISMMDYGEVVNAILAGDHEALSAVPGIGKKTAQKIIIELKDRLKKLAVQVPERDHPSMSAAGMRRDVVDALITLGFSRGDSLSACANVQRGLGKEPGSVDNILKLCLKELGEKRRR